MQQIVMLENSVFRRKNVQVSPPILVDVFVKSVAFSSSQRLTRSAVTQRNRFHAAHEFKVDMFRCASNQGAYRFATCEPNELDKCIDGCEVEPG